MTAAELLAQAVAEGRRQREATLQIEANHAARIAREKANDEARRVACADSWVIENLPDLATRAAASGKDRVDNIGEHNAAACRRAGLQVESEYVQPWHDEGIQHGDYMRYWVVLP